jgi:hypothetical protein
MPKISRRKGRVSRLGKRVVRNTRKLHGGSPAEVKNMHDEYKKELDNGWYKNIHESKLEVSINLAKARCHVENLVVKSTLEMAIAMYNELNDANSKVSNALAAPLPAAAGPASAATPSSASAAAAPASGLPAASAASPATTINLTSEQLSIRPKLTVAIGGIPPIKKGIELINTMSGEVSQYKRNLYNAIVNYIHNVNKSASDGKSAFGVPTVYADNTPGKLIVDAEMSLFNEPRTPDHNIPQKDDMYKMTTYIKDIIYSMDAIYDALNLVAHPSIPAIKQASNTAENVGAYANSLITSGKADRSNMTDAAATAKKATAATTAAAAAAAKAKTALTVDDPLIADKCKGVYEITVWFGEPVNQKLFERLTLIHSLNSFEAAYIKLAKNIFELTDEAAVPKPVVAPPPAPSANPPDAAADAVIADPTKKNKALIALNKSIINTAAAAAAADPAAAALAAASKKSSPADAATELNKLVGISLTQDQKAAVPAVPAASVPADQDNLDALNVLIKYNGNIANALGALGALGASPAAPKPAAVTKNITIILNGNSTDIPEDKFGQVKAAFLAVKVDYRVVKSIVTFKTDPKNPDIVINAIKSAMEEIKSIDDTQVKNILIELITNAKGDVDAVTKVLDNPPAVAADKSPATGGSGIPPLVPLAGGATASGGGSLPPPAPTLAAP